VPNNYNPYGAEYNDPTSAYDTLNENNPALVSIAGSPIGGLTGLSDQVNYARQQDAANRNRAYWDTLSPPTADQLSGPSEDRDAQLGALAQLQQWGQQGPTGADRQAMETTRARDSQAAGAQRRALSQQASARGLGGSGLDFATQQQAMQAGQQRTSDAESAMMQSAQQRQLAATNAAGSLAGNIRSTDIGATQQAWQDAAARAAGATGQYSTDASTANSQANRSQQNQEDTLAALGSIIAAAA